MTPVGPAAAAGLLAVPPADRLTWLRDHELADTDGLAGVLDEAERLAHTDPAAAVELGAVCAAAAEAAGLDPVLGRACYLHARIHAERGELDSALELIDQARDIWRGAGLLTQAWRTDLGRMTVLDDLGRHAESAATGHALVAALDASDGADSPAADAELRAWLRSAALENLGVAFGFMGQHQRALEAYAVSEATYAALGMTAETARPRANRGIELLELGRAGEALEVLRSAAASFAEAGDRLWSAKCLGHLAQALQQLGRLVEALRMLEPARATLDDLGAKTEAARLQIATAGVYLTIGLYGEARGEARVAAVRTEAAGMRHDAATAHLVAALAALGSGDHDEAAADLEPAAAGFAQVGDGQQLARARLAQADVAAARGDRSAADAMAADAATALRAGGWPEPLAWATLRRFDLADDDAVAAGLLEQAQQLAEQVQLPRLREACDLRAARLHRRRGDLAAAERLLRGTVDRIEESGANLPDHALRTAFHTDRQAAHDELVDLLVERGGSGDADEAWRISDRAKARTLVDLVTGSIRARPGAGSAPELTRWSNRLDSTYGDLLLTADPAEREALRDRAEELERRISTLRLRAAVSELPHDPAGPPAAGIRRPGPIVAFHVVGDDVIAFSSRSGSATALRLAGALPQVDLELDRLAAQWTRFRLEAGFSRRHAGRMVETTRAILHALDGLLLAPVRRAGLLDDCRHRDEIVVVPHGRLHHVPFHALHDGTGYLVQRRAVTVAPTAAWLPEDAGGRARAGDDALVLAVPDARAPSVAAEARSLRSILPDAQILVGPDAVSSALIGLSRAPAMLHIACHGLYRPGNPLFSALRLADRWVTGAEVLDLDLEGTLVTLSSCESGRPGTATVDPVGLAWAFLAAGAAGAIVSQWVVHDDVTVDLMSTMYRELRAGARPAAALRTAQLTTAADHPHPFFWAPFTFVTSPRHNPPGVSNAHP